MTQLNFRVQNALAGTFRAMDEADAAAATVGGWKVGKSSAGTSSELTVGTESTGFTSNTTTPKPTGLVTGSSPNAWRSVNPYSGSFDTTAWSIKVAVRSVSNAFSGAGRARVRVFASANADGTGARELTAATQVGTTAGPGSTSADVISTVTWTPAAAINLSNEYIFIAVAWEIVTASGSNNADADIRTGSSGTTTGSNILTGNFTAPTPKSGSDSGTTTESATVAQEKVSGTARISLAAIGAPTSPDSTNTSLHVRARKASSGDAGVLNVALYQGATLIESYSITLGDSFATDQHFISNTASITDWTQLEIQLQAVSATAHDSLTAQVSYVDLATPVGSGTPVSSSDSGTITEIVSPLIRETGADVGTASETIHPFVRSLPDTSVATEATALSAPLAVTDTNSTTTESASISAVNPVSASDANSTTTESGSARVVESTVDVNGAAVEATAIKLAAADANSTTTDSAAPAVGISNLDVNGVTTETAGTGSPISTADFNGSTVEAIQLRQVAQPTDSNGTVTEITILRFAATDGNSTTTESASAGNPVAVTDTNGAVTESAGFSAQATAVDAGSASLESTSLTARPSASETNGSTTEVAGIGSIPVLGSQAGTDTEISSIVSSLTASQAASASESASTGQITPVSGSDSTPHGSETASLAFQASGGSQGGSAVESASVVVLAASGDTAELIEQATALVRVLAAESGTALDDEQITVVVLPQDAGSSAENASILQGFLGTDAAQGIEAFQIIRTIITGLPGTDHLLLSTQVERGQVMSAIGEKGEIEDAARVPEKAQLIGAKLRG